MSSSFQDSVVLITSRDPDLQKKRDFGTGFVIHRTHEATYLLTCAHVVRDVGGAEKVQANGIAAKVVASGESVGFDLAVLRVEGLWNLPVLPLSPVMEKGQAFEIAGIHDVDNKGTRLRRPIQGYLGKEGSVLSDDGSESIKSWDLHIEDEDKLLPGYSGSPVVDRASSAVLAMVTHRLNNGDKGLAIAIEGLKKIWKEMPSNLFQAHVYPTPDLKPQTKVIEVFISYSKNTQRSNDNKLLNEFVECLSSLDGISVWHQGKIIAGQNEKIEIEKHFHSASIFLLLISSNYLRDYENKVEIKLARERHRDKEFTVIPVLLSPVNNWERKLFGNFELGQIQALPKNGKFVTGRWWKNKNEAFYIITQELLEEVERILAGKR